MTKEKLLCRWKIFAYKHDNGVSVSMLHGWVSASVGCGRKEWTVCVCVYCVNNDNWIGRQQARKMPNRPSGLIYSVIPFQPYDVRLPAPTTYYMNHIMAKSGWRCFFFSSFCCLVCFVHVGWPKGSKRQSGRVARYLFSHINISSLDTICAQTVLNSYGRHWLQLMWPCEKASQSLNGCWG